MSGSVILTGANGSSGLHAATHLLNAYPELTAILTVRNATDTDVNTNTLRTAISNVPNAKFHLHEVDLADLSSVHRFATTVADKIASTKYPPLKAIICNAFYWNLIADRELTIDGIDKTMQVGFVSHAHLVLRLLDHFDRKGGRVELVSSVAHFRVSNPMTHYVPGIPADLDELVHPQVDSHRRAHGALQYANAKLVATIWGYALDRHLRNDPKLSHISAVVINPGDSADSRAFEKNVPAWVHIMSKWVVLPLRPLYRLLVDPTWRPSYEAGIDVMELAVNGRYTETGYYTMLKRTEPDDIAKDEEVQDRIWKEAAKWAGVEKGQCALAATFD